MSSADLRTTNLVDVTCTVSVINKLQVEILACPTA